MAELSEDELAWLRAKVGTAHRESDLADRYDRLGTVELVAREILEERLADLVAQPASFSISGEYSQSTGENIRALREQLSELDLAPGGSETVTIVRPNRPVPR